MHSAGKTSLRRDQEEREAWQEFGRAQLAKAYGPEEPEYGLDEVKPGLDS